MLTGRHACAAASVKPNRRLVCAPMSVNSGCSNEWVICEQFAKDKVSFGLLLPELA